MEVLTVDRHCRGFAFVSLVSGQSQRDLRNSSAFVSTANSSATHIPCRRLHFLLKAVRSAPSFEIVSPGSSPRKPLTRKEEAKKALFAYLHETRRVPWTLARHIAFNAPSFTRKLLSASPPHRRKDARNAVERYLRRIPINEFEPFFESIGISPSKIDEFLPEDEIYLVKKQTLLENVGKLVAFGIPMNKIGRVYREAESLFSEPSEVLQGKLKSYMNLGLSNDCLALVFTSCPHFLASESGHNDFEALVDKMLGLGFEISEISSVLEDICKSSQSWWATLNDNLTILLSLGCTGEIDGILLKENFLSVSLSSSNILKFRIDYLSSLGLLKSEIGVVILSNVSILKVGADRPMVRNVQFLKATGLKKHAIADIVKRFPRVLGPRILDVSGEVLNEFGLSERRILALLNRRDRLHVLSEFGLDEDSVQAFHIVMETAGKGEMLRRKLSFLKSYGASSAYICQMVKSHPRILNLSQNLLEKKVKFLVHSLGISPKTLESCLICLRYSLEKRIMPRSMLWLWLKQNNLLRQECPIRSLLVCSNKNFVERFLSMHNDASQVYERFKLECSNRS